MAEKTGKNLEDIGNMNRALVIKLLHSMKNCSRIELSEAAHLERATITNIINDFIKWGLVVETGIISGKKGRRSIGLLLNGSAYLTVCIRILRNSAAVGLFDLNGQCRKMAETIHTDGKRPQKVLNEIILQIRELMDYVHTETLGKVIGIGFALPGPYMRKSEKIVLMTNAPGWENIDFRKKLSQLFNVSVFFEHDANCGALAEWWYGNHSIDKGSILFFCAGQGIGSGLIENGSILRGSLGIAGEVGHMSINFTGPLCECGNRGCLELYGSAYALREEIKHLLSKGFESELRKDDLSLEAIFLAISHDDPAAMKAFEKIAWILGFGLASLVNVYNPNIIMIGDKLSAIGDKLLNRIKVVMKEHLPEEVYDALIVNISQFQEDTILHGVNAMILDQILRDSNMMNLTFNTD